MRTNGSHGVYVALSPAGEIVATGKVPDEAKRRARAAKAPIAMVIHVVMTEGRADDD